MNMPRMCMCSPFWIPLPPSSPSHPSGSSQCTSPKHPVSCMKPGLVIHFIYDNLHVSMPFSHIIPPCPLPQSPKDCSIHLCLFYCLAYRVIIAAKSRQSCPTPCDPIDGSPPGSPVPGILQARTLEWVAISFSSAWMWKVRVKSLSRVWLLATPGTAAHQAPPSMGFSRQEYWSGVPVPSPQRDRRELSALLSHWSVPQRAPPPSKQLSVSDSVVPQRQRATGSDPA